MPSGGVTYGAPAGFHDDCVMALALANHRRWERELRHMFRIGLAGGMDEAETAERYRYVRDGAADASVERSEYDSGYARRWSLNL